MQFELQRLQNEIEEEVQKYNQFDKKGQQLVQTRSSLLEQESENSLVLKEIEILPEDARIYKQVGGVLIDQKKKEVKTTLSNRLAMINNQLENTNELIKKNETEQKAMAEKIQKAKQFYYEMAQKMQGTSA
jgi:prefoldin beta subunit